MKFRSLRLQFIFKEGDGGKKREGEKCTCNTWTFAKAFTTEIEFGLT